MVSTLKVRQAFYILQHLLEPSEDIHTLGKSIFIFLVSVIHNVVVYGIKS